MAFEHGHSNRILLDRLEKILSGIMDEDGMVWRKRCMHKLIEKCGLICFDRNLNSLGVDRCIANGHLQLGELLDHLPIRISIACWLINRANAVKT